MTNKERALQLVDHMPHSAIEIAGYLQIKPSEAIAILKELVADGLIQRGTTLWEVTDAGSAKVDAEIGSLVDTFGVKEGESDGDA